MIFFSSNIKNEERRTNLDTSSFSCEMSLTGRHMFLTHSLRVKRVSVNSQIHGADFSVSYYFYFQFHNFVLLLKKIANTLNLMLNFMSGKFLWCNRGVYRLYCSWHTIHVVSLLTK